MDKRVDVGQKSQAFYLMRQHFTAKTTSPLLLIRKYRFILFYFNCGTYIAL